VPDVLTPAEFRALFSRIEQRDRAMVPLAGSTGLRRSELIALTWGDIAFDRSEIIVRRSRVRQWFGEPKTEASRKPVPLCASVLDEVKAWQSRALDTVYPIVYLDALVVKMRTEGRVENRAVYVAIGITMEGNKEVLGLWTSANEGAKFWLQVLTELNNRGVKDIFMACVDGLKGFPQAVATVFPKTTVQLCIVHNGFSVNLETTTIVVNSDYMVVVYGKVAYREPFGKKAWRETIYCRGAQDAMNPKWLVCPTYNDTY